MCHYYFTMKECSKYLTVQNENFFARIMYLFAIYFVLLTTVMFESEKAFLFIYLKNKYSEKFKCVTRCPNNISSTTKSTLSQDFIRVEKMSKMSPKFINLCYSFIFSKANISFKGVNMK